MNDVNRRYWEGLAALHGRGRGIPGGYYDLEALVAGERDLHGPEAAAVGDVAGLDVVHLQSHVGIDSVLLARRGARVTAVDFSPIALDAVAELAQRCGVEVERVEADTQVLPPSLHGRFDVAYATIGVICWIADLAAWMRNAAATLRPGGRLVLVELHPMLQMIGRREPLLVDFPYAFDGPYRFDEDGSYADASANLEATEQIVYAHSLGEVVTVALEAGLRVDRLEEHTEAEFEPRGILVREDDGRYRLRLGGQPIPVLFTLVATRP
jgi:SAM-dependent methyltransferase